VSDTRPDLSALSGLLDINDGDRPSRLELGRQLTGELPSAFSSSADTGALDAFSRAIEADRARLPAFDPEVLRAAAERLDDAPPTAPTPKRPWWRTWSVALLPLVVAALALFVVQIPDGSNNRLKGINGINGPADLDFFVLQDGEARPGVDGERVRPGDRVQFSYRSGGLDTLVIIGVDGAGTVTVFYPERGERPEPIEPDGRRVLEGSIELDDAPGPEVFVGVFGVEDVEQALELVESTYDDAGLMGVASLGHDDVDPGLAIDVVRVEKEAP